MGATIIIFALCGGAGALIYSFPVYLKAVSKVPPAQFALVNCLFSILVGMIFATVFTAQVGAKFPWTVDPEPWPLALVIGLGSNPLVPLIIQKLEKWVGAFEGKKQ